MKHKKLIPVVLLCTTAMLAGTVTAAHPLTNSTFVWKTRAAEEKAADEVQFQSALLGNAIREYFGLEEGEALTRDMTAQIESITFCLSVWQDGLVKLEGYEDKYAVKCIVNGGAILDGDGESYPSINEELPMFEQGFNGKKSVFGYEPLPITVRTKYLRTDEITDDWNRNKMMAFYIDKDITNPALEPEAVEELLLMHPCLALDGFSYIDPMAKPRELAELLKIGFESGIVNEDTILDSTVIEIPKTDIANFPLAFTITCDDGFILEHVG